MKIKELSELTGLSSHTLRYYEKIGLIQNVKRDTNGIRIFKDEDVHWVNFLLKMKITRMPLEELRIYADSFYAKSPNVDERIEVLINHKKRINKEIDRLKKADEYIDYKINYYAKFKQDSSKKYSTN